MNLMALGAGMQAVFLFFGAAGLAAYISELFPKRRKERREAKEYRRLKRKLRERCRFEES